MKCLTTLITSALLFLSASVFANEQQNKAVDLAIEALSRTLKAQRQSIEVISVKAVNWRNSGLGCLHIKTQHRDVITPGYRIKLKIGTQEHWVHTDKKRAIVCKTPITKPSPITDPNI